MLFIRAFFFNIIFWINTMIASALIVIFRPFGINFIYPFARLWSRSSILILEILCGVKWEVIVEGKLPEGPAVYLSNHQSALETIAFPSFLPQFVWVLKRELHYIPIFGWCVMALGHIGINRSAGSESIRLINKEGKKAIERGSSVAIFPEGTRAPYGQLGEFSPGGAGLAINCGVPVVPIAQNAGKVWGKQSFGKSPGKITVIIGEPIPTAGMPPSERKKLNNRVKEIIAEYLKEMEEE